MLENCNSYIIPLYCSHIPQDRMPFSGTAIRNHKRSLCYSWTYVTSWTGSCGCFQTDNTLNVDGRVMLSNLSGIIAVLNPPINKSRAWKIHCRSLANKILNLYWPTGWGNLLQTTVISKLSKEYIAAGVGNFCPSMCQHVCHLFVSSDEVVNWCHKYGYDGMAWYIW